jgi:hypothetical protein
MAKATQKFLVHRAFTPSSQAIAVHLQNVDERLSGLAASGPAARAAARGPEDELLRRFKELRRRVDRLANLLSRTDRVAEADRLARRLDQLVTEATSADPDAAMLRLVIEDLRRVATTAGASARELPDTVTQVAAASRRTGAKDPPGFLDLKVTKEGLIEAAESIVKVVGIILPLLTQLGIL